MPASPAASAEQRYRKPPEHDQGRRDSGATVSSSSKSDSSKSSEDDSTLQLTPAKHVQTLLTGSKGGGGYAALESQRGTAASGGHFVWRHVEEISGSRETSMSSSKNMTESARKDMKYGTGSGQASSSGSQALDGMSKRGGKGLPEQDNAQDEALEREAAEQSALQDAPTAATPEELEALRQAVPKDANGQPTSFGSMGHQEGTCRPCLFFGTQVGCSKGVECSFCHLPHKRRGRTKPCKGKRDRYKKLINRIADAGGVDETENHSKPQTSKSNTSVSL